MLAIAAAWFIERVMMLNLCFLLRLQCECMLQNQIVYVFYLTIWTNN